MTTTALRSSLVAAAAIATLCMALVPLSAQSQVTPEKCGSKQHEVILGDVLLAFPIGSSVRNVTNPYLCPRDDGPLRGMGDPLLVERMTLSDGDEFVYHLYFSSPLPKTLAFDYEGVIEDIDASGEQLDKLPVESGFYVYKPSTQKLRSKYSSNTIYIAKDPELVDPMQRPYVFFCSSAQCLIRFRLTERTAVGTTHIADARIPKVTQLAEYAKKLTKQASGYVVGPAPK